MTGRPASSFSWPAVLVAVAAVVGAEVVAAAVALASSSSAAGSASFAWPTAVEPGRGDKKEWKSIKK